MAFVEPTQTVAAPNLNEPARPVSEQEVSEENLRERRYLWTARAFAMIFVGSLITNILMLMSLSSLTPLTRVMPYELTFADKKSQVVEIAPMRMSDATMNNIVKSMLRQYVVVRQEIKSDPDEMAYNWGSGGLVDLLSTDNVFNEFQVGRSKILEDAFAARETRTVKIKSIMPLANEGFWIVNFDLIKHSPDRGEEEVIAHVATVQVDFQPTRVLWDQRLKNPIGFKVQAYGIETLEQFNSHEQQKMGIRGN